VERLRVVVWAWRRSGVVEPIQSREMASTVWAPVPDSLEEAQAQLPVSEVHIDGVVSANSLHANVFNFSPPILFRHF
jgi:hypothetical protein